MLCEFSPPPERNLALARRMLVDECEILGPVDETKLPVSMGFYRLVFPDHCCTGVFYACIYRFEVLDAYRPGIVVSCSHFEYGDYGEDLEMLTTLAKIIGLEAFHTTNISVHIPLLDPYKEKLVMYITPKEDYKNPRRAAKQLARLMPEPSELPAWLF